MLAVLGATGKIGGTVARALRQRGLPVRAVVRDPARAAPLAAIGCELAVASIEDEATMVDGLTGVESALVICPLNPRAVDSLAEHTALIETLCRALTRALPPHVVTISDYGAHDGTVAGLTVIFHRLEKRLRALPSRLTLLRSAEHMENWGRRLSGAARTGSVTEFYGPPTRPTPVVSAADVGLIAASLLAEGVAGGGNRTLHIEGPRRYLIGEFTETMASLAGRAVEQREVPREDRLAALLAGGMSESHAQLVFDLIDAQNAGRLDVEPGGEVRRGATTLAEALAATQ